MAEYCADDILRIAKRYNNKKRTYLLVNPLQGKHIPVSPTKSLKMMETLGNNLSRKYPGTKLVIGFAETATAIGAVVASCFEDDCVYIHTTREDIVGVEDWILFLEEHSHAAEQKLVGDNLSNYIEDTDNIIFVDDEISTGKTLINIIVQLKNKYPIMKEKRIIAASLLNRVSDDNMSNMENAGIKCEYLVKLPDSDFSKIVKDIDVHEAERPGSMIFDNKNICSKVLDCDELQNPRKSVRIGDYNRNCIDIGNAVLNEVESKIRSYIKDDNRDSCSILVLGTEECMYPALKIGELLEKKNQEINYKVFCHATTRSPIGVMESENYPISSGNKIRSFYDNERVTYIYNMKKYDAVIVISDNSLDDFYALSDIASAFYCDKDSLLFYINSGKYIFEMI